MKTRNCINYCARLQSIAYTLHLFHSRFNFGGIGLFSSLCSNSVLFLYLRARKLSFLISFYSSNVLKSTNRSIKELIKTVVAMLSRDFLKTQWTVMDCNRAFLKMQTIKQGGNKMMRSIDLEECSNLLGEMEDSEVRAVMERLDVGEEDARGVLLALFLENQAREFHNHLALCVR